MLLQEVYKVQTGLLSKVVETKVIRNYGKLSKTIQNEDFQCDGHGSRADSNTNHVGLSITSDA